MRRVLPALLLGSQIFLASCIASSGPQTPTPTLPPSSAPTFDLHATWTAIVALTPSATATDTAQPSPTFTDVPPTPIPCAIPDELRRREAGPIYQSAISYTGFGSRQIIVAETPPLDEYDVQLLTQEAAEEPAAFTVPLSGLSIQTLNDFLAVGAQRLDVSGTPLPFPHQSISEHTLQQLIGEDLQAGWDRFEAQYPDASGYWELSSVGLDCQYAQALAFIRHVYGYAGMTGTLYLLERNGDEWFVSDEYVLFES